MITREDILRTKRKSTGAYRTTTYEVRLLIGNSKAVDAVNAELVEDAVYERLAKEILHNIYGDLREPIHELIRAAKGACQTIHDMEAVCDAGNKLSSLMRL